MISKQSNNNVDYAYIVTTCPEGKPLYYFADIEHKHLYTDDIRYAKPLYTYFETTLIAVGDPSRKIFRIDLTNLTLSEFAPTSISLTSETLFELLEDRGFNTFISPDGAYHDILEELIDYDRTSGALKGLLYKLRVVAPSDTGLKEIVYTMPFTIDRLVEIVPISDSEIFFRLREHSSSKVSSIGLLKQRN